MKKYILFLLILFIENLFGQHPGPWGQTWSSADDSGFVSINVDHIKELTTSHGTIFDNDVTFTQNVILEQNASELFYVLSDGDTILFNPRKDLHVMRWRKDGTVYFSIDSLGNTTFAGNVGIGTMAPNQKLEVNGYSLFDDDLFTSVNRGIFFNGNNNYASGIRQVGGANGTVRITSNSVDRLSINSTGNVGIGTTAPGSILQLSSSDSNPALTITSTANQSLGRGGAIILQGKSNNTGPVISSFAQLIGSKETSNSGESNGVLGFYTNNGSALTEWARITSQGNVGIGTTEPTQKLTVWGGDQNIVDPTDLGSETLTDGTFTSEPGAGNWGVSGGWDATFAANKANFNISGGVGNLSQNAANMIYVVKPNRQYQFTYTVSNAASSPAATITTAVASAATSLTLTNGAKTIYFKSAAAPGVFKINATAGVFSLDECSLKEIQGGDMILSGSLTGGGVGGIRPNCYRALTDEIDITLFDIALPTLAMTGGEINYRIVCTDGTDMQSFSGVLTYSAVNKAGVYTTDIDEGTQSSSCSAATTIADTWSIVAGTNSISVKINVNTSLTPTTFFIRYTLNNLSEQVITLY